MNTTTDAAIQRHLPLITSRIEFQPCTLTERPIITPKIAFKFAGAEKHRSRVLSVPAADNESETGSEVSTEFEDDYRQMTPNANAKAITKPQGQPSRPNSGGYRFNATTLGWDDETFKKITVSYINYLYTQ
jgi:hypothetical protein